MSPSPAHKGLIDSTRPHTLALVNEHSSPKRKKKGDTRRQVLKAAGRLFATRGYAATSISAICRDSGVAPSSIYWEFGNKAGVLAAVLEDSAERWLDQSTRSVVKAMRDRPGTGVDRLVPYFDYMADALAEGPDFLRLMIMVALERQHADPRALEIIRSHRARAVAAVARILGAFGLERPEPDGVTARDLAQLTIACFDGAFAAAQIDSEAVDLRRMFALLYSALVATLVPVETPKPE
jgi:AcrR family transcriptional regulator